MSDFARQRQRYRLGRWRGEMAVQFGCIAARTCMDPTTNVVVNIDASGNSHTRGLMRCANVSLCPVCAPTIRSRRAADIDAAQEAFLLTGGSTWFATFTIPHSENDDPAEVLDRLKAMWRAMQQGTGYRTWKAAAGIEGTIRAFEVTHGASGWHWHLHVLYFARMPKFNPAGLAKCWERQFASIGLAHRYVPKVSCDIRKLGRRGVGAYLGKLSAQWGAGAELARADSKRRSIGPAQMLELAHDEWVNQTLTGDVTWLRRWEALERASKGLRWIEWSRGLRVEAAVWQMDAIVGGNVLGCELLSNEEATDEEAARGDGPDEVVASWHVPAPVWRKFRRAGELGLLLGALVSNDGERYGCWLVTPHRGEPYSISSSNPRGSPGQLVMAT